MKILTITCIECNNDFKWTQNSTIKPKRCRRCQNKKLLSQSNLYAKDKGYRSNASTYPSKQKKRLKTANFNFYKTTAWKWFSRYMLLKTSIDGEITKCCTCGKILQVNKRNCHLGHWIKVYDGNSTNFNTSFEETNTGPQCDQCNNYKGGQQEEMYFYLRSNYGQEEIDRLYSIKRIPLRLDKHHLDKVEIRLVHALPQCRCYRVYGVVKTWLHSH